MYALTAEESVYIKGLSAPPRHSILPPLIQTPGGGGRRVNGRAHVSGCSHAVGKQRVTVTPLLGPSYVNHRHTHTHVYRQTVPGAWDGVVGVNGWVWEQIGTEGIYSISCCLCLLFHCLHAVLKCATISSVIVNTPSWLPRQHNE